MRWMNQPGSYGSVAEQQQPRQQQQAGPWQQRQWLISGPTPPSRARHRSLGGGTGEPSVSLGRALWITVCLCAVQGRTLGVRQQLYVRLVTSTVCVSSS
jgi:hypothetical protein